MEQTIKINVPEGKVAKYNPDTNTIEFVDKDVRSKSWEEFCRNHPNTKGEWKIVDNTNIIFHQLTSDIHRYYTVSNTLATKEDAEGILALIQLTRLHDEWVGDWKGDYTASTFKYIIIRLNNKVEISYTGSCHYQLDFPTREMAKEFLDCFRDLIEKAKRFI